MFKLRTPHDTLSGSYFDQYPAEAILAWAHIVAREPVDVTAKTYADWLYIGGFFAVIPINGVLAWIYSMVEQPSFAFQLLFIGFALIVALGVYAIIHIKTQTFRLNSQKQKEIARRIALYADRVRAIPAEELREWAADTQRGIWRDLF